MWFSTLRRLEVFIAVVEAGSFGAGADRLGIARPSVSEHIKALEDQIGCGLFTRRRGSSAELTEQGTRLYERGVDLIERAERLARDLGPETATRHRRKLVVSAHRLILDEMLAVPLANFAREHEEVELTVEAGTYDEVLHRLREGTVDVGFFMTGGEEIDLPTEPVGVERVGFYAAPGHPLAGLSPVPREELIRYPLILPRRESRSGRMISRLLAAAGVESSVVAHQLAERAVAVEFAAAGLGVWIAFARAAAPEVRGRRLVELVIDMPALSVELRQAITPRHRPNVAVVQFLAFLKAGNVFG